MALHQHFSALLSPCATAPQAWRSPKLMAAEPLEARPGFSSCSADEYEDAEAAAPRSPSLAKPMALAMLSILLEAYWNIVRIINYYEHQPLALLISTDHQVAISNFIISHCQSSFVINHDQASPWCSSPSSSSRSLFLMFYASLIDRHHYHHRIITVPIISTVQIRIANIDIYGCL